MAPHDLKQIYMCLILPYIYYVHSGYKNDEFIALDLWYFNTQEAILANGYQCLGLVTGFGGFISVMWMSWFVLV